jgi:hypothetical protein
MYPNQFNAPYFQMGMPQNPYLYAQPTHNMPGWMYAGSAAAVHYGYMQQMPSYAPGGNFMEAAKIRFYDNQRSLAAASAAHIDAQRARAIGINMISGAGRSVTPEMQELLTRATQGGAEFAARFGTNTPAARAFLDTSLGGISAMNVAASMQFLQRRSFDSSTGTYGVSPQFAAEQAIALTQFLNSKNEFGLKNSYGMKSDAAMYGMASFMREGGFQSANNIQAMLLSDTARRGYAVNPGAFAGYSSLIAAGAMDPSAVISSQAYNRNAPQRAAEFEANARRESMAVRGVLRAQANDALAEESTINAVENATGYGTFAAGMFRGYHDMDPDTIKAARRGLGFDAGVKKTKITGLDRLKIAAYIGQDAAFRNSGAAEILKEAADAIGTDGYAATRYGKMSEAEQIATITSAVGKEFDIDSVAKTVSGDSMTMSDFGFGALAKAQEAKKLDPMALEKARTAMKNMQRQMSDYGKVYQAVSSFMKEAGANLDDINATMGKLGVAHNISSATSGSSFANSMVTGMAAVRSYGGTMDDYVTMFQANQNMYRQRGMAGASELAAQTIEVDMMSRYSTSVLGGNIAFGSMNADQTAQRRSTEAASFASSEVAGNLAVIKRLMTSGKGVKNQALADRLQELYEGASSGTLDATGMRMIQDRTALFRMAAGAYDDTSVRTLTEMTRDSYANNEVISNDRLMVTNQFTAEQTKQNVIRDSRGLSRLRSVIGRDYGLGSLSRGQLAAINGDAIAALVDTDGNVEQAAAAMVSSMSSIDGFAGLSDERKNSLARAVLDTATATMGEHGMTVTDMKRSSQSVAMRVASDAQQRLKAIFVNHADLTTRAGFGGFMKEMQSMDPETADLIRAAAVGNGIDIGNKEVQEAMAGFEKETESFFADYRKPLDSKAKKMFGKGYLELTDDERSTLLKDKRMSAAAEAYDNVVAMARSETAILGDETKKEVMKAAGLSTEDGGMTATFNNVTISLNGEVVAKNASSTSPVKSDSKGSVKTPNH